MLLAVVMSDQLQIVNGGILRGKPRNLHFPRAALTSGCSKVLACQS